MTKPSSRNLAALPDIATLQNLCRSLATLDAIICRQWEYRYYSCTSSWERTRGELFFMMRNGSGDEFQIMFNREGAVINGFAHESTMSSWAKKEVKPEGFIEKLGSMFGRKKSVVEQQIWPGVVDDVPQEFRSFISGERVRTTGTTFCIWRKYTDKEWQTGRISFPHDAYGDGSEDLLYILDGRPETYRNWAIEYYEEQFEQGKPDLNLIKYIYESKPLTKDIVLQLNPDIEDIEALKNELAEIGYECKDL